MTSIYGAVPDKAPYRLVHWPLMVKAVSPSADGKRLKPVFRGHLAPGVESASKSGSIDQTGREQLLMANAPIDEL